MLRIEVSKKKAPSLESRRQFMKVLLSTPDIISWLNTGHRDKFLDDDSETMVPLSFAEKSEEKGAVEVGDKLGSLSLSRFIQSWSRGSASLKSDSFLTEEVMTSVERKLTIKCCNALWTYRWSRADYSAPALFFEIKREQGWVVKDGQLLVRIQNNEADKDMDGSVHQSNGYMQCIASQWARYIKAGYLPFYSDVDMKAIHASLSAFPLCYQICLATLLCSKFRKEMGIASLPLPGQKIIKSREGAANLYPRDCWYVSYFYGVRHRMSETLSSGKISSRSILDSEVFSTTEVAAAGLAGSAIAGFPFTAIISVPSREKDPSMIDEISEDVIKAIITSHTEDFQMGNNFTVSTHYANKKARERDSESRETSDGGETPNIFFKISNLNFF